jgi:hypothetical protein
MMSDTPNIMEDYIRKLIKEEMDKQADLLEVTLKEEDASRIVLAILPHLDELISKRVKQHFTELADLVKGKFSQ